MKFVVVSQPKYWIATIWSMYTLYNTLYSVYMYCIVAIQYFGCNTRKNFIHSFVRNLEHPLYWFWFQSWASTESSAHHLCYPNWFLADRTG